MLCVENLLSLKLLLLHVMVLGYREVNIHCSCFRRIHNVMPCVMQYGCCEKWG